MLRERLARTKGVERAVFMLVRQALNSMLKLPGRLLAKLAAESDPRATKAMLNVKERLIAQTMQRGAATAGSAGLPQR